MILLNNLEDETYKLPAYTSKVHERNSQYSMHNVTYQSVENS